MNMNKRLLLNSLVQHLLHILVHFSLIGTEKKSVKEVG